MKMRKKPRKKTYTILGRNSEFEGNLKFYGTLLIDGSFKGNITGEGTISIGEKGIIESDIHVSNIIIYGEVHGNIFAEEKIEINAPGKVFGHIEAPIIEIEKGVVLQGICQTQRPNVVAKEELEMISSLKSNQIEL
jgi:cytoskeletal protein CcmA (bactofilin family)